MAAGGTLTLSSGADYVFTATEVWSGIKGNSSGTRGAVLSTLGHTLSVSSLDHLYGGISATKKDVVTLAGATGNTITVKALETLVGSAGNDRVLLTSNGTSMAVESVETIIGASTGTALIVLTSTAGNTMSVAYLKSMIGTAGKDVINFNAAGSIGTTTVVTMMETLIGTSGLDVIATVSGGSNTVLLQGIEIFLGNGSKAGDTVTLAAGGSTIGVSFIETLIGSSGTDLMTMGYKSGTIDMRSGGGTVSVSSVETIVGGTGSRDAAILLDVGNSIKVASLDTLIGGGGKDVVTMTLRDGTAIFGDGPVLWQTTGSTMQVSQIETLIGTSGYDAVVALNAGDSTISVSAVEALVGKGGIEVVSLGTGGNTVAVEGLETLIGSAGADVVTVRTILGTTMTVTSVESLTGGAGTDVVSFTDTTGTIHVSGIETIYTPFQTLTLNGADTLITIPSAITNPSAPVLSSASDSGVLGDATTNATRPTLIGTVAAGSVVNLYGNGIALGTGTADGSGVWSVTSGTALSDGAWTLTAKTISSGIESGASDTFLLTIDTTAPSAPSSLALSASTDTGQSTSDGITRVTAPTVTGSAAAGSTVRLYDGGTALGSATADSLGVWSIASPTLSVGSHTLTSVAVDSANNTSAASGGLTVTIDTTVAAPTGLTLASARDSGTLGDNITNLAPIITGTAEPLSSISIYNNGTDFLGVATASAGGAWQFEVALSGSRVLNLTAQATDLAGNTSAVSSGLQVTVDTTPPSAPSAPTLVAASDSGTSNSDRLTNVTTPTFTGTAEAGSIIDLLVAGTGVVGTGTADGAGSWTITSSSVLSSGDLTVSTQARDAAGNTRDGTGNLIVTIDTTAPTAPSGLRLTAASDSGTDTNDQWTNVTAPTVTGTAAAGSTVSLYDGGILQGSTTANAQGSWEFASPTLSAGTHSLTAKAVDAAGNTSAASGVLSVTIDLTATTPTGLALTTASDTGLTGDGITNQSTPTITGTAERSSQIALYEGTKLLGQGTSDTNGLWTITASALDGGMHTLTARTVDGAGNTSGMSADFAVTIDVVAPGAPVSLALASGSDTGTAGDRTTQLVTPTIQGTAEAGSTVALYDGATLLGTATAAAGTGAWAVTTGTLTAGTHALTAKAIDVAGNTGSASAALSVTIDTASAAPAGLAMTSASDSGTSATDRLTKLQPTVTGTAEAGAVVTLYSGATAAGTGTADGSGLWSVTTSGLSDATHTLTARAVDIAGNTSTASAGLTVTVDTTAPALSALAADANPTTPTLSGTAEAGSVVTLYDSAANGAATLGVATAGVGGVWSITTPELGSGTYAMTARAVDAAGNESVSTISPALTVTGRVGIPGSLLLTSDTGTAGDRITSTASPTLTGTALAGGTVTLSSELGMIGTGTADGGGLWTIAATGTLADGVHTLSASVVDSGTTLTSSGLTITIDTTRPDAPAAPVLLAASDSGLFSTDRITNAVTPTVTGSAEAKSVVTLYDSDGVTALGSTTASDSGVWSLNTSTLGSGAHTLTVQAVDIAGNTSLASGALTLTVDTTADMPGTPVLGSDTGAQGDNITSTLAPTITGTAEAGGVVSLYDGANLVGTGTADGAGLWSVTASALGNGAHSLTARLMDVAGNTNGPSSALNITIDTDAPGAPGALALTTASDSGTSSTDRLTNVTTPTLTGTAESDSTVVLYDGGVAVGTAVATSGAWTITSGSLSTGSHSLTAQATDAAGNTGAASSVLTVTIDTTTPNPSGLALTAVSDTGLSATDRTTNATTLSLTGSAEANSVVTLYDNGSPTLGSVTADGVGAWSYTGTGFAEGEHTLTASAVDFAGNTSSSSNTLTVTVDRTVAAPTGLALDVASDTGTTGDNRTKRLAPTITGTAEAGGVVSLYDSGAFVGMATADGAGGWSVVTSLGGGEHTLTAQTIDVAGNTSAVSGSLTITIDATAPIAPTALTLAPASDTGVSGDRVTQTTTPIVSGTAEANSVVHLYDGSADVGTATADGSGAWTITSSSLLAGSHTLTARAEDATGNTSGASSDLLLTIDTTTTAPSGLALTTASDTGRSASDRVTKATTPTVTGTAEAGSVVTLYEGSTALGSTTTANIGLWSIASATLGEGTHTLTSVAIDAAGNTSTTSNTLTVTVDLSVSAPTGLDLATASDTGVSSSDRLTRDNTPTLTGTAEADAVIQIYDGANLAGTTTVGGSGVWSVDASTLSDGNHTLLARAVDAAGNTSTASGTLTVTIDTAASSEDGLALSTATDTGVSSSDGLTRLATPAVVGVAEAFGVVTVYEGAVSMGSATAGSDGAFAVTTASLSAGDHTLTAQVVDRAGNTATIAGTLAVTVDLTTAAPSGLVMARASDSGVSGSDGITNNTTPLLSGTAEAGSTVTLYDGATALGTAEASGLGAWSIAAASLAAGSHTLTAVAIDRAGNTSVASAGLTVTIDTAAEVPSLGLSSTTNSGSTSDTVTNDSTPDIVGTTEAGGFVSLYEGATLRGSATADGSGNWTITSSQLGSGLHTLTARGMDAAGNTSAASATLTVTIDTVAPNAPTTVALTTDTGVSSVDRLTKTSAPTLSGSAEANSVITLFDGTTAVGTATAGGTGAWTVTSGTTLADGVHTLTVTSADLAGNTSAASAPLSVTIDTASAAPSGLALTTATDSGRSNTDGFTNLSAPTVTGTAEAGSTVTLLEGGSTLGSATANNLGVWSISTGTLSAAAHTLTAVAVDKAGNTSASSADLTVTIDLSASTPTALALAVDSGASATDRLINTGTPTVTGSSEANGLVLLYEGSNLVGSATADGTGTWSITASALGDGTHGLSAKLIDAAGNTSAASSALSITIDTAGPGAPGTPVLASGSDTGSSSSDRVTGSTTPTITGTAEAGSTVILYEGGVGVGTATATGGTWSITTSALSGSNTGTAHTLQAVAYDAAGNSSAASSALTITVDSGADAPGGLTLNRASNSGLLSDQVTNVTQPTITGSAEAGSVVTLYEDSTGNSALGSATADSGGAWSITTNTTFPNSTSGPHTLLATTVDVAGNSSAASSSLTITIDTVPDTISVALDSGSDPDGDRITSNTMPTLGGTVGASRPVTVTGSFNGGADTALGTVTADGSGVWSFTPSTALSAGTYAFTIASTDVSNNAATTGVTVTVDLAADTPNGIALASGSDSGTSSTDRRTNVTPPTLTGSAEAGSVVTLYDNGASQGSVTANSLGSWSFTTPTLGEGDHTLTARAVDAAGNSSGTSSSLTITIDTTATTPTGLALDSASDSGTLGDGITRSATPTVGGTAEASNVVILYEGATVVGSGTANGSGAWAIQTSGLSNGAHTLTAKAIDAAGNTSAVSGNLSVTIDTAAPTAPSTPELASGMDSGTSSTDRLTNITTPTITGTAEASGVVTVYDGASLVGTATADGGGIWTVGATLAAGTHSLTAVTVDAAGNTSAASNALAITIDTTSTAPSALSLATGGDSGSSASDGLTNVTTPTILGRAETNSIVTLLDGATVVGSATADGSGVWSVTPLSALSGGAHTLTATAIDIAWNTSAASSPLTLTIDTANVAPTGLALASGSDTGRLNTDLLTANARPTVTGTAEASSVVSLYDGASLIGLATTDNLGVWSIMSSGLTEGTHTLTARSVDVAGNTSGASSGLSVTIDLTAESPTIALDTPSTTDSSSTNLLINITAPQLSGTAEAGSIVTLYDGVATLGSTTASGSGAWAITTTTLGAGAHSLSAVAVDLAGNTATSTSSVALTVDTTAPTAPIELALSADSDSGVLGNSITNNAAPAFTGKAETYSHVLLFDGATLVGEADADDLGAWAASTSTLSLGQHTLTAKAVDAAGNTSTASGGLTLTIIPEVAAPVGLTLAAASDTGVTGDNRTSSTTPTITGTASAASVVTLYANSSTVVGTATANGAGQWSLTTNTLAATQQTLSAVAVDIDGVQSLQSAGLTVTIDTAAPIINTQVTSTVNTGAAPTANITLGFTEEVSRGTGNILLKRVDTNATVATIAVTDTSNVLFSGSTVTILPGGSLSFGSAYYMEIGSGAILDRAGNAFAGFGSSGSQHDFLLATEGAPAETSSPTTSSPPSAVSTVDGVQVQTGTTTNTDGTTSHTIIIPVVLATRPEVIGNNVVADIPLVASSAGASLLTAQIPTGMGLEVRGSTTPQAAGTSLTDLIREIQAHTTTGSTDQNQLTGGGTGFLASLPSDTPLLVQTITPTATAGATASTQSLVITGTPSVAGNPYCALVIDTRGLPSGSTIELQNVEFAAVIGAVRVTGGDGSQNVWGDGSAQYIVLGADDDTLHGGGGNDFVGSKTGNDLLYGEDGDDTVQGGDDRDLMLGNMGVDVLLGNIGADTLFGGRDNDTVYGGQDDDLLYGDPGDDSLMGDPGADTVLGGDGADTGYGGNGTDLLLGNMGADVLFGNMGQDTLYGGLGNDTLYSGRDDDLLFGDLGDDVLYGDLGNDTLTGGAGADTFVFGEHLNGGLGDGHDVIADFNAAEGDRIQLRNGATYTVRANGVGNAVIVFSNNDDVTLTGISTSQITSAWFVAV